LKFVFQISQKTISRIFIPMENISYKAVPVITKKQNSQSPSVQPSIIIDNAPVQSMGAVNFRAPLDVRKGGLPNDITVVFANATAAAVTYIFGDPNSLIQGILAATYVKPTVPASSIDAVTKTIGNNPVVISSLNYRITVGTSAQFSNKLQYADGDIDGTLTLRPINMPAAQRNTQQNDKILTVAQDIPMDDTTGIILVVAANTTVEIDMSFSQIYRSGANF
jgi:hypothetical protein